MKYCKQWSQLGGVLVLGLCSQVGIAGTFSENFDSILDKTDIATFTLESDGESAEFAGGWIKTEGEADLYNSGGKSWMVLPSGGVRGTGTSTGEGSITFANGANSVTAFLRGLNGTSAEYQLLDENDTVVTSGSFPTVPADWFKLTHTIVEGAAKLKKITVTDVSGNVNSSMIAIDDLMFVVGGSASSGDGGSASSDGGGSGAVHMLWILLLISVISIVRRRVWQ